MSVLSIVLLIIGILALIEGATAVFFTKFSLKIFRRFARSVEKNIKSWGIVEIIIAIILIILGIIL
ncbi:hypothetical protein ACFL0X_00945 [Nanoarchaeota archaeon]